MIGHPYPTTRRRGFYTTGYDRTAASVGSNAAARRAAPAPQPAVLTTRTTAMSKTPTSTYIICAVRADTDDKAWTVTVEDRPEWTFREKNFGAITDKVRDLAHTHDGIDPAAVTVTRRRVSIGPIDVTDRLADLEDLRRRSQELDASITATTTELIGTLRGQAGLTTRDTGAVLSLTGARIHQIEKTATADGPE